MIYFGVPSVPIGQVICREEQEMLSNASLCYKTVLTDVGN